jgi:hypothetical protein
VGALLPILGRQLLLRAYIVELVTKEVARESGRGCNFSGKILIVL